MVVMAPRSLIRPMLAVPGDLPRPSEESAWTYEMKWDGVRAVVYVEGGECTAISRNDRDISVSYPELAGVSAALDGIEAVLDGELVAFDSHGRPSFGTLQQRMHIADATAARRLASLTPVVYVVFDVLRLSGQSLLQQPYANRRELLERLELNGDSCLTAPVYNESGADVWQASLEQGMEGVVAKQRNSIYEPGRRSQAWRKIKHIQDQEIVIGGWREGSGRRAGRIGSLMMGLPDGNGLRYVGQVGTGFTEAMLRDLAGRLGPRERTTSPFATTLPSVISREAHWVEPDLVGEVAFAEWTGDGVLRQPSWRGLRPDRTPADIGPSAG
jgi:bifunctional non-homologous end joining protein LigD